MVVPMFAFGFMVPIFALGLVGVCGFGLTPVVPAAPGVTSGVVVVGELSGVDCGVTVTEPGVLPAPVPTLAPVPVVPVVDGVVSTVGGVDACGLTEPGVPAAPVPTAPVLPACPGMVPVLADPVAPL